MRRIDSCWLNNCSDLCTQIRTMPCTGGSSACGMLAGRMRAMSAGPHGTVDAAGLDGGEGLAAMQ